MGLFSFFRKKPVVESMPIEEALEEPVVIPESTFVDNSDPEPEDYTLKNNSMQEEYPIEKITAFLRQDLEQAGYQDAVLTPEDFYLDSKVGILIDECRLLVKDVERTYNNKINKLAVIISEYKHNQLLSSAQRFEVELETCNKHLNEIEIVKKGLEEKDLALLVMVAKYKRGFMRGKCEKDMALINN